MSPTCTVLYWLFIILFIIYDDFRTACLWFLATSKLLGSYLGILEKYRWKTIPCKNNHPEVYYEIFHLYVGIGNKRQKSRLKLNQFYIFQLYSELTELFFLLIPSQLCSVCLSQITTSHAPLLPIASTSRHSSRKAPKWNSMMRTHVHYYSFKAW